MSSNLTEHAVKYRGGTNRNLQSKGNFKIYVEKLRKKMEKIVLWIVIATIAMILISPFLYTFSTSLKSDQEILEWPPSLIPKKIIFNNYLEIFRRPDILPISTFILNSFVYVFWKLLAEVSSCLLVAYGFARLRFRGRDILFIILLSTMMLPWQVRIIPTYILFAKLKWLDTYLPMIIPNCFATQAAYVFLLRQFYLTIPIELEDSARIDGCGYFGTFTRIILPNVVPAILAVCIFSFIDNWNDFFGPLIYLNTMRKYTIQVGILFFRDAHLLYLNMNLIMAAAVLALLPPIILFIIVQKRFIKGIVITGVEK